MKIDSAEFIRSAPSPPHFLKDDLPHIAFVGRSNVGKSSLLNRMLHRKKLARTSSTPGRTRAVNYFLINRKYYFVDLPGYGYAKASKVDRQAWADLVDAYCRDTFPGGQVVLLVDAKVGATELDVDAFHYLASFEAAITIVATKSDRLSRNRLHSSLARIRRSFVESLEDGVEAPSLLPVSARTGDGIGALWNQIGRNLQAA
ncbi:MAG: ribosome biogenesis GTP-binding protein YihA/YsxC [Acidobacteriota bacterium]